MDGRAKVVTVEENKGIVTLELSTGKRVEINMKTIEITGSLKAGMAISYSMDKAGNFVSLAPDSMT